MPTKLKKSTDALVAAEGRLTAILATIDDVVWSISAHTYETLYLNPAAERVYGRSAGAFYQDSELFLNIVHTEDRERVAQMLPGLVEKGPVTIQYRIVRPDGEVRWLEDRVAVARSADRRPIRFDGIASDITERRAHEQTANALGELKAEEALLKAGALQSAIFNSANFSSIATDAKGVIQIFNVGAERMLGYMAAEVMNQITPADISDPQEVIARAKALSVELGTPITPGLEALVFKASRGIEDIYELTYGTSAKVHDLIDRRTDTAEDDDEQADDTGHGL